MPLHVALNVFFRGLEDEPQLFRQRSGSLESQSQLATETGPPVPTFTMAPARRSNSTEVLDDGSSYTSHSSAEYSVPGNPAHRRRARGRHRNVYANTGSMPNLAQPDTRCHASQPRGRPTTTAYCVTGYRTYQEPEPYPDRDYMYNNEMQGHYSLNPSYRHVPAAYHGHYGADELDGMSQNPYATLRPPRSRPAPRANEHAVQKEMVAEHLRGWYHRNAAQRQPAYNYDYDRGSQQSLGYQTTAAPHSSRNISYSGETTAPRATGSGAWWFSLVSHVGGPVADDFFSSSSVFSVVQRELARHHECL